MPSPPQPVADLLAALARALSALGVRWFLFGAQAAILHGAARLSADVDVTVDLGNRSFAELVAALAPDFDTRIVDPVRFAEETRVLPFVHRVSHMPLDVILAGPGLEEQFFAGATERLIGDVRVPVACAEDLVAMKILAGRPRDVEDVAAVIRARRDLDVEGVRSTLRLLERALDRADLVVELDRLLARAKVGTVGPNP